jgi:hypothetical protein
MIRAGGEAAQLRLDRELAEANLKRIAAQKELRELGPIQKQANRIASSNAFGKISILMISAFSILLAFAEPTEPSDSPRNSNIRVAENIFTFLFTIELAITWVAAGPIQFFRGAWNSFDFFVVGVGWLAFTDIGEGFPLACIRVARCAPKFASARCRLGPPRSCRCLSPYARCVACPGSCVRCER